jgi:hypothetical protein
MSEPRVARDDTQRLRELFDGVDVVRRHRRRVDLP